VAPGQMIDPLPGRLLPTREISFEFFSLGIRDLGRLVAGHAVFDAGNPRMSRVVNSRMAGHAVNSQADVFFMVEGDRLLDPPARKSSAEISSKDKRGDARRTNNDLALLQHIAKVSLKNFYSDLLPDESTGFVCFFLGSAAPSERI